MKDNATAQVNEGEAPAIKVLVTFLSKNEGGRPLPAGLLKSKDYIYSPHLVVGDPSQRQALFDKNNRALEHYLGVWFCDGPESITPNVAVPAKVKLLYYPEERYESLVSGAEFTIREGPHIVGYGRVTVGMEAL